MKRDIGRAADAAQDQDTSDVAKDLKKAGEHGVDYVKKTANKAERAIERNISKQ